MINIYLFLFNLVFFHYCKYVHKYSTEDKPNNNKNSFLSAL